MSLTGFNLRRRRDAEAALEAAAEPAPAPEAAPAPVAAPEPVSAPVEPEKQPKKPAKGRSTK